MTNFIPTSLNAVLMFAAHGAVNNAMLTVDLENLVSARTNASGRPALFGPMDAAPMLEGSIFRHDDEERRLACRFIYSTYRCTHVNHVQRYLRLLISAKIPVRLHTTDAGTYLNTATRLTQWLADYP